MESVARVAGSERAMMSGVGDCEDFSGVLCIMSVLIGQFLR